MTPKAIRPVVRQVLGTGDPTVSHCPPRGDCILAGQASLMLYDLGEAQSGRAQAKGERSGVSGALFTRRLP